MLGHKVFLLVSFLENLQPDAQNCARIQCLNLEPTIYPYWVGRHQLHVLNASLLRLTRLNGRNILNGLNHVNPNGLKNVRR